MKQKINEMFLILQIGTAIKDLEMAKKRIRKQEIKSQLLKTIVELEELKGRLIEIRAKNLFNNDERRQQ